MVAAAPDLMPEAMAATHCWHWCAGWAPERWPAYAALHAVDDWALLMDLQQVIKDNV